MRGVADLNSPIPGGLGNFTSFFSPSLSGGNVAFRGLGSSGQSGIYADIGGLKLIADENTAVPGGSGNFTGFGPPSISGSNLSFQGVGSSQNGIYVDNGGLSVVADLNTPIPSGAANFTSFGTPSFDGSNVAFRGFGSGQDGIYTDIGNLNVVADLNTLIPGGTGNFTSFDFDSPLIDSGNVAFEGFGSGQNGIYTDIGGLNVVADLTSPIPGGSGNFTSFQMPSLDDGSVAFRGLGSGQNGIYTRHRRAERCRRFDLPPSPAARETLQPSRRCQSPAATLHLAALGVARTAFT